MMDAPTEADRFWAKVDASGDCWEWTASKVVGYGKFGSSGRAHRWAWEHLVGPIPEGLDLDHLCRNRACVNPDHLEPVTRGENTRRGYGGPGKNHRKRYCKHGHPLFGPNLVIVSRGRDCRTCRAAATRRYYARKREEANR